MFCPFYDKAKALQHQELPALPSQSGDLHYLLENRLPLQMGNSGMAGAEHFPWEDRVKEHGSVTMGKG